jgi:hypothetical protein
VQKPRNRYVISAYPLISASVYQCIVTLHPPTTAVALVQRFSLIKRCAASRASFRASCWSLKWSVLIPACEHAERSLPGRPTENRAWNTNESPFRSSTPRSSVRRAWGEWAKNSPPSLGPVQQGAGALIELLATGAAAEPAIALGCALGSLRHGFRSTFQAPHLRPPLCEKRPYTQPSPRRPGVVARALTEPGSGAAAPGAQRGDHGG